jgi:hypothetical protein
MNSMPPRPRPLKSQQEIPPARSALAIGELDREHLPAAVPVDSDRNQHHLPDNHPGLGHPLIARRGSDREGNSDKMRNLAMVVDKSTPFAVTYYSRLAFVRD